jgi:hypothetical protein
VNHVRGRFKVTSARRSIFRLNALPVYKGVVIKTHKSQTKKKLGQTWIELFSDPKKIEDWSPVLFLVHLYLKLLNIQYPIKQHILASV